MGKFNKIKTALKDKFVNNFAGGQAYKLTDKQELVAILLSSFLKDSFYEKQDDSLKRLVKLIEKIEDKKFIAKTAIFARDKFGMRSVSHVAAGEIAKLVKGEQWTKNFFEKVVVRVDDMSEILSYYLNSLNTNTKGKKRPIPNSLKKGFKLAFDKFDAYQLAKYRGENKDVKLVDLVNLIRPKGTEKNSEALNLLIKDELKSFDTWETKLSQAGQKAESEEEKDILKSDAWTELIETKKIGYFALLRNLRNILSQAPHLTDKVCELLIDEKLINKSKVLPFRFSTAISEIEKIQDFYARKIIIALNKAVDISLKNIPKFSGKTLIALDVSGSMSGRPAEIGSLFATVLAKANDNAEVMLFDTSAKFMNINPNDSTLTIAKSLRFNGGGTDFHCIFNALRKAYDRIIILSDMQGWVGYHTPKKDLDKYKTNYKCNPFIYSFDLMGYGTSQFPEDKIFCLYGFSDKIFELMSFFEQDKNALINEIEKTINL